MWKLQLSLCSLDGIISVSFLFLICVSFLFPASVSAADVRPYPLFDGTNVGKGWDCKEEIFRAPIFQWNYNMTLSPWYNVYDNNFYMLPDIIYANDINHLDEKDIRTAYQRIQTYYEMEVSRMGLSAVASVKNISLNLMLNQTVGHLETWSRNEQRAFTLVERAYALFSLNLFHGVKANHPQFINSIAQLPNEYGPEYIDFVADIGTHVVISSPVGGHLNFTVFYEKSLYNHHEEDWVDRQIGLSISMMELNLSMISNTTGNVTTTDYEFDQASNQYNSTTGGDLVVLKTAGYNEWLGSVKSHPSFIKQYAPKWKFIFDYVDDPIKKENLQKAVIQYCSTP